MRYGKGPLGALLDEYERALNEFVGVIDRLDAQMYDAILDLETPDTNCQSVKTICFHVLFAGYGYANAIREKFGADKSSPERFYPEQVEFPAAMAAMFAYTEQTLADRYSMTDDDLQESSIPLPWTQRHDLETLLEHAIVHILRHRRQVEYLTSRSGG